MKCFICVFLVHFMCLQLNFVLPEAADECSLPGGARGECVALAACAQYAALLQESTTTELGLRLTQERRCGLEGNSPKVCCPTVTSVPAPKIGMYLDDSDYEDELPEPGNCGRFFDNSDYYEVTPPSYSGDELPLSEDSAAVYDSSQPPINQTDTSTDIEELYTVAYGLPVTDEIRYLAPWMALLAYKRSPSVWECGGSIITKRHVLTAAHCIRESLYVVRVGELDLANTEKEFSPIDFYIKKKIPHENYTKYHNDIAILVLDGTIPIDDPYTSMYINPVCLLDPGYPIGYNEPSNTFITGWGETETNERSTNLLYAYLDIVDQDTCKRVYSDETVTIDERVFCAGDPDNWHDACNGDSGGPLIGQYFLPEYGEKYYFHQLGLISYGYKCAAKRYIGVYTNVTHFMPWIREKVTGKRGLRQWTRARQPALSIPSSLSPP